MADTSTNENLHLTSGRLLARNTVWNLVGNGSPLIVAVVAIPILIHSLGKDRFGVLALAWSLIGYASLFDIGIGRALTQLVAQKLGMGDRNGIPALVWTSLLLMTALGAVGALAIAAISPWLAHHALKVPEPLQPEVLGGFYVLAVGVPAVIVGAGLRGLLEAHQRFDMVSIVRISTGALTFIGPLLVLPFSRSLVPVVGALVVVRYVACFAYLPLCLRVIPELRGAVIWHGPSALPLLRFGGWTTVTNIVGPMMLYMDRFVIGAMMSAAAVAYYATPYEIVTKLFVVSGAISGVMFPAFSFAGAGDRDRSLKLYKRSTAYTVVGFLPVVLILILGAKEGLTIWLGSDFAAHSYRVAQLLLVGTFALSVEALPFVLIQGLDRPDVPAKLNLIELPFYAAALFLSIRWYGLTGAAIAWVLRAIVDALSLFYFARRLFREPSVATSRIRMAPVPSIER